MVLWVVMTFICTCCCLQVRAGGGHPAICLAGHCEPRDPPEPADRASSGTGHVTLQPHSKPPRRESQHTAAQLIAACMHKLLANCHTIITIQTNAMLTFSSLTLLQLMHTRLCLQPCYSSCQGYGTVCTDGHIGTGLYSIQACCRPRCSTIAVSKRH